MPDATTVHRPYEGRLFNVEVVARGPVSREVVRHPGAVLIVPRLEDERLVLVRNYRVAVAERLWEFPAGTLEAGESPAEAAGRELEEETGYRAARIEHLADFYTSPGFCDERIRIYAADGLEFVGQRLEPHEDIEVGPLTVDDVQSMVDDGRIIDGKTIAALHLWVRRQ